jgi:hypothetical protein
MTEPTTPSFAEVFGEDLFTDADVSGPMLDPAMVFPEIDDAPVGTQIDDGRRQARFDGDTSELTAEMCWALQQLVAAPHVTEESKSWPVVLDNETRLRSRLSELGLVLVVNREHRYAYTRQGDDPSPRGRAILRSRTLTLAASALALYLYQQYVLSPDDPIVERTDMVDHMMAAYRPADDTDEVAFKKKINAAIGQLGDLHILKPVNGSDDRFTIYAAITAIVTAEQVTALEVKYREIAGTAEASAEENGSAA